MGGSSNPYAKRVMPSEMAAPIDKARANASTRPNAGGSQGVAIVEHKLVKRSQGVNAHVARRHGARGGNRPAPRPPTS